MSYEEKNTWVFLAVAVVAYGIYLTVLLSSAAGAPLTEAQYAPTMLATIGGAIAVGILGSIAISITSRRVPRRADQRDREISRLGEHVGQAFVVLGAVAALVFALLELDWFWIANVVYLFFVLSAVVGSIARLVAYRRGVPAW
jgi:MFS family permease